MPDSTEVADPAILQIEPFKIISSPERLVLELLMSENAGLHRNQFAMNSFGFPPIPIPEPRNAGSGIRMAPDNVTNDFIGHPIYWIDPRLTEFDREKETEEQWSIRMYFLIAGFGYWTEQLTWVNYLLSNGFDMDEGDIHAYHTMGSNRCNLDDMKILQESDMVIPADVVQNSYISAIARCQEIFTEQMEGFISTQTAALAQAKKVIGDNSLAADLTPDNENGLFMKSIVPDLLQLSYDYDNRLRGTNHANIADLTVPVIQSFTRARDILVGINRVIALLSVPIISGSGTGAQAFGEMTTYLSMSTTQASERNENYDFPEQAERALGIDRDLGKLQTIIENVYQAYRLRWRQLRLTLANYERTQVGLPILENYTELERELINIGENEKSATRGRDVIKEIDGLFGN